MEISTESSAFGQATSIIQFNSCHINSPYNNFDQFSTPYSMVTPGDKSSILLSVCITNKSGYLVSIQDWIKKNMTFLTFLICTCNSLSNLTVTNTITPKLERIRRGLSTIACKIM